MEIRVRNVNEALPLALGLLAVDGVERESRNGPVRLFTEPVMTIYDRPRERVLFDPTRDANPFFHLFESLWMLAGRDDVGFVAQFVKRMRTFSDDGKTMHGAYGKRWLHWFTDERGSFQFDQLSHIIRALNENPDDRRQVLSMWDGHVDPHKATGGGKDVPCNTQAYVWVDTDGRLNLTLLNRSNDLIWGAYGANAVHFSYLQEFIAAGVGREVGRLYQVSNNLHAYMTTLEPLLGLGDTGYDPRADPYLDRAAGQPVAEPFPLVSTPLPQWREDLGLFLEEGPVVGLRDPFFRRVATPMWVAHQAYRCKDDPDRFDAARMALDNCKATDWQLAAREWLDRRERKAQETGDV